MADIRQVDKAEYRRLLNEIGEDYCPSDRYCLFKEVLLALSPSRRLLVQMKLIDKIKYERSKMSGKDIGWEGALQVWIDEKMAEKFSSIYKEGMGHKAVYAEMFPMSK